MKVTYSLLKHTVSKLNELYKNSFIDRTLVLSKEDLLITFSLQRKTKLFISLNHQNVLIGPVNYDESTSTILGPLNDIMRNTLKGAKLQNIQLLNNDRIIEFEMTKMNDYFEIDTYYLIIELIGRKPNLIILNNNREIIFATHYTNIDSDRLIIKGFKYEVPSNNLSLVENEFDYNAYLKHLNEYLEKVKIKRIKDKYSTFYKFIKNRIIILDRKIEKLLKENIDKEKDLIYKDHGDYLLACIYEPSLLDEYLKENDVSIFDSSISIQDNANKCYKKYKKSKLTISHNLEEIEKAKEESDYYKNIYNTLDMLSEDELEELSSQYIPNKANKNKTKSKKTSPYCTVFEGIKVAFGKTSIQNDTLTFDIANKEYIFLHIYNQPGSHVVIMDNNPSSKTLEFAGSLCLALSKKVDGDIQYTKVKNVKKGSKPGLVIFKNYQSFYLKNIDLNEVNEVIKNSTRIN